MATKEKAQNPTDVLVGARQFLTPRQSWGKGAYHGQSVSGRVTRCFIQALKDADGEHVDAACGYVIDVLMHIPEYHKRCEKKMLASPYGETVVKKTVARRDVIITFNDHADTTKYDVLRVLDEAIIASLDDALKQNV